MTKLLYLYNKDNCTLRCTYIRFDSNFVIVDYYSVTFDNVVIINDYFGDERYMVAVDKMTKVWRKVIADESKLIMV